MSGKSAALFHHRAICKTPMALPKNRRFCAIQARKPGAITSSTIAA
jgi:hypothetical protein